jgi:hypothetical protein
MMIKTILISIAFASLAVAQVLVPLDAPLLIWTTQIPRSSFGNECVAYREDVVIICTTASGVSVGLLPDSGVEVWRHTPTSITESPLFSATGVAFGTSSAIGDYMLHAVSEGFEEVDPSFW